MLQQSSDWYMENFDKYARALPRRTPEIPVGHPDIGFIGVIKPGERFALKGMSSRSFYALMRDEDRAKNPYYYKKHLREMGAITTWDGVLTNRIAGYVDDRVYVKASQTVVASNWSSFFRSTGMPAAATYTDAPGATMNATNTGAMALNAPTGNNNRYLLNLGVQHLTGTNIVLFVDLLAAANNIATSAAGNTAINTGALTRYTDGKGLCMIAEVANAIGASAANITVTYNDTDNANSITAAIALTASAANFRLQPISGGPLIPLATGDQGIKEITNVNISANMAAGGRLAILLYKPLIMIPTLATTTYVERSTPGMLGGVLLLQKEASNNQLGCFGPFVLPSTTSTGVQTYFLQSVEG